MGAASENAEGNGGREAVDEGPHPRPSRPGEGAGEDLAAGSLRPPGTDAPAWPDEKQVKLMHAMDSTKCLTMNSLL